MFPSPPVSAPLSKDGFEALVRGDYNSALKAFQKAADKGDAASLGNLAYLYETGKGVTQDYTKAIELYQRAAAAGCVPAEVSLAAMYESGRGIPRDYKKAALLLDKAATQGNARAQAG
jgi:TPR repeat protein